MLEVVTLVGGGAAGSPTEPPLTIGTHTFRSRLLVGTGKYATPGADARLPRAPAGPRSSPSPSAASGSSTKRGRNLLDFLDPERYTILPNTAGCFNAEDALRTARLGRELLLGAGQPRGRLGEARSPGRHPDPPARPGRDAGGDRVLVAEGFQVLCYTSDDPVMARRLRPRARPA